MTEIEQLRTRCAELEEENAELRKNAERYEWLNTRQALNFAVLIHEENSPPPICPGFGWKEVETKWELDTAIDAAKGGV